MKLGGQQDGLHVDTVVETVGDEVSLDKRRFVGVGVSGQDVLGVEVGDVDN